jgi:outer membrane protein assembly factor BamA
LIKKNINYSLLRYNIEFSGNILNGIYSTFYEKTPEESYQLLGIDFSQYIKTEMSFTFNQVVDKNNTFVYRVYGGLGYPYGNSKALPFEKKFFSGGSSGVRAWHARALGPGSYVNSRSAFLNETADIKIEANVEYRFKLFWMLEGALFIDAGNIWAITSEDERKGALFEFDNFYKQIALGTGAGIRMNLGFFIFRFDMGIKVHDPAIKPIQLQGEKNYHWIPFERAYNREDFVAQIGIGYPF